MGAAGADPRTLDLLGHLQELRARILTWLGVVALATVGLFPFGEGLMTIVKRPLPGWAGELIFISPAEVLVSYLKIVVLAGLLLSAPVAWYEMWTFLAPALDQQDRQRGVGWALLALGALAAGTLFSYFVALPRALNFLFSFGAGIALPRIVLAKYVSFFVAFMLAGGLVFEIPVVIGLLTDLRVIRSTTLRRRRREALIVILVMAAVITPTTDVFNMLVFAVPMGILFEAGIWFSSGIERRQRRAGPDAR